MAKEKRYTVTLDAYIYARNDREAMVKAAQLAEKIRNEEGNEAQVLELHSTPFASFISKLIHKGRLTIFENKLIEA